MQFSKKVDYGLFLLITLLKAENEIVSLRQIAEGNHISFYFLQKIALLLRRAGMIKSGRGKSGGYKLARPPQDITLKEIIEALEGPVSVVRCLPPSGCGFSCERENMCSAKSGLKYINDKLIDSLNETTLLDFIR